MKQVLKYSLKVWITIAFISPLLATVLASFRKDGLKTLWPLDQTIEFCILIIIYGLIISSINWLLLLFITIYLNKKIPKEAIKRLLLLVIGEVSIVLLFFILYSKSLFQDSSILWLMFSYAVITGLSIGFYKPPSHKLSVGA